MSTSLIFYINYLNISKNFDLARQYSLVYFLYSKQDDKSTLSVLRIYLDSMNQKQSYTTKTSNRQAILGAFESIIHRKDPNDISELLYVLNFNQKIKRYVEKEFNNNKINHFLETVHEIFAINISSFYEMVNDFYQFITHNMDTSVKKVKIINNYELKDKGILEIISDINLKFLLNVDYKYLNKYKEIILNFLNVNDLTNYSQKKNIIKNTEYEIDKLVTKLRDNPSFFSVGLLLDNLSVFLRKIKLFEQDLMKLSLPKLYIEIPTTNQFTIKNDKTSSDAINLVISIKNLAGMELAKEYIGSLPGDKSFSFELDLESNNKESQTLNFEIKYDNIIGDSVVENIHKEISFEDESEFVEIINPYAIGGAVEDKNMFIGREHLIQKLSSMIKDDRNRCVILYGQKRAGKSSTFNYLEKALLGDNYIAINFSMGDSGESFSSFVKTIALNIEDYYEETFDEDIFDDTGIELRDITEVNDLIRFIKKALRQINNKSETKKELIFLIDEFTYIYGAIRSGLYPESFMKNWKAMLEKNIFKALLIGQDSMPDFIAKYPNEFGVIQKERLSYLDKKGAKELITQPILMEDGSSRYIEDSVDLIIELSSGSPYFIQKICQEIVNYLNLKRTNSVTNFVVNEVVNEILTGNNSVSLDFFDNLFSLGDGEDEEMKKTRLRVLINIANNKHIDNNEINLNILDELQLNDIIEKNNGNYSLKVGLFKEYLVQHYGDYNG